MNDIKLSELKKDQKMDLLYQLSKDHDTMPFFEMEVQGRLNIIIEEFRKKLDEYIKKIDAAHARSNKNMWHRTYESYVEEGEAKVCADMNKIMKEVTMYPELDNEHYSILDDIKQYKNKLINNSLSDAIRGKRAYHKILKYEGELADIMEESIKSAYLLGVKHSWRMTEETKTKLEEELESETLDISLGHFDKDRMLQGVLDAYLLRKHLDELTPEEREKEMRVRNAMFVASTMVPLHPEEHPDVMEFLKNL